MTSFRLKSYSLSIFALLVTFTLSIYMLTYRGAIQSGDTLRALDAVTSQARYGDWLMDESSWFKPALIIREEARLPLQDYDVEERLNVQLAVPLLRLAETLPRLGNIHTVWLFNVFVTSLIVGLIYYFVRALEFSDGAAAVVAISAGIGTILWAYSQTFFREPLSALFILAALLLIQHGRHRKPIIRLLSLAFAAAGLYLAYLTKFSSAFAIPPILIFALPDVRRLDEQLKRRLTLGLLAVAVLVTLALIFIDPLPAPLSTSLKQLGIATEYIGSALRSYLISPGASLWGTSPIILLAIAGCLMLWRQRRFRLVLTIVMFLICYATGHALTTGAHWFGGLSWPPRFLLPVIPVLMLATAPVAERLLERRTMGLRMLWALLLVYGIWIQFSGVSLSWSHFSGTLPAESQGLAEWPPSMFQPQYFRWALLPQRWQDLGFDFLWTRTQSSIWGISFTLFAGVVTTALCRLIRHSRSRWRDTSPLLAIICAMLIVLNLTAIYDKDPRTQSKQAALHEAFDYLEQEAQPHEVLLLPGNDYGNFVLNHLDAAAPRTIILPRPLAQAASDKQPALVLSNNANSWFDVQSLRIIQHLAGRHDRLWVLDNTSPFMPWSFRPLERYLALHYYPVQEVRLTTPDDTVRLMEFSTRATAPDPMSLYFGDYAADLHFGESIRVISYYLPNGVRYQPGEAVEFSLLWQTDGQLDDDYTVATFIVDASSGQVLAQGHDSGPQFGFSPTSKWQAGVPVWDNRAIRLPADTPPGKSRLWIVMYSSSETGEITRLPVKGGKISGEGAIGVLPTALEIEKQP